jgi:hypothetical protein
MGGRGRTSDSPLTQVAIYPHGPDRRCLNAPCVISHRRAIMKTRSNGRVAQPVRARGSHPRGHRFESCLAHPCGPSSGPKWRNWQTRYVQGVVGTRPWEFKSPLRHRSPVRIVLIRMGNPGVRGSRCRRCHRLNGWRLRNFPTPFRRVQRRSTPTHRNSKVGRGSRKATARPSATERRPANGHVMRRVAGDG